MIARPDPRRLPAARRERTERKDVQHMIEKMVRFITDLGRGLSVDIAKDEPSHIHVPRPSRVVRPDDAGTSPTWGAHVSDEE
jgi:hypothetical protein